MRSSAKLFSLSFPSLSLGLGVGISLFAAWGFLSPGPSAGEPEGGPLDLEIPEALLATGDDETLLEPEESYIKTSADVISRLRRNHYRKVKIDDELSSELFDRFLEFLDPAKLFFLRSDIEAFQGFRTALDDALKGGDMRPAFLIFNRLQQRRVERLTSLLEEIEGELAALSFDGDDVLQLDREEADWPATQEEADALWRKRLKNEVLDGRLEGKELEKTRDELVKRYENQLSQLKKNTSQDVFDLFMNSFLMGYDPHTSYFSPRVAEGFDISMSLSLEGIGAQLDTEGEYTIIRRLIPGGPAEKGGDLQVGDRIEAVGQDEDGEWVDIVGWRATDAVTLIRGPKGSTVRLKVLPGEISEGSERVVTIVRDEVKLEDQAAQKKIFEIERDGVGLKLGVIELPAFYMDFRAYQAGDPNFKSSSRDVARLLSELEAEGVAGVVVDLRGNSGGSLIEAVELSGLFVEKRPIVQVRDARGQVEILRSQGELTYRGPVVVLVDRFSASASEIFAAALQDLGRAVVVGGRTFGKGTVQGIIPLSEGELKLTQAKFYRVSGASTQSRGVEPDIAFPDVFDHEEIGESALDEALPWDEIDPVRVPRGTELRSMLPDLQAAHDARAGSDPDLVYLDRRMAALEDLREREVLSLNEDVRRAESDEIDQRFLALGNEWLVARGEEPVESLEELPKDQLEADELDALQEEACEVLFDVITHP